MKWKIVADSSCDLDALSAGCGQVGFSTVPFHISVGEHEYTDREQLDTLSLIDDMEACTQATKTACPSPGEWKDAFEGEENVLALTISGRLSGSYNSASAASHMLGSKNITVLDSKSTGPAEALCIRHILAWIREGRPFDYVSARAHELIDETKTVFALSSYDNLVKNGRMSKIAGFIAKKLGMWGIGIGNDGMIAIKAKVRGVSSALKTIVDDMLERGFEGREVIISHCHNLPAAQKLCARISEKWHDAKITVLNTRGLNSYYAERGGLIVAFR